MLREYEMIIGLEVHCELKTKTKIFCGCSTAFGAQPNTQCCPVCMGMPGSLPVLNRKVVEYAVKAGLATNCSVTEIFREDRKNYFYPDLPKAYQITQKDFPICQNGWITIPSEQGERRIGITEIHIEEDAGKLLHTKEGETLCDYNRCGVPLIEIVSAPELYSAEDAKAYVQNLRSILLFAGVSDCKMQEGSLRCDVNLSVRKKGEQALGVRTEIKNLNSFQFMAKAIQSEFQRQVAVLESGGILVQETRRYDQSTGKTDSMRSKEDAEDYRYFPEPDLFYTVLNREKINKIQAQLGRMPEERKREYCENYGISQEDACILTQSPITSDYFETAAKLSKSPRQTANVLISCILPSFREEEGFDVSPEHLAELSDLLFTGKIGSSIGKKLLKKMREQGESPSVLAQRENLWQISDEASLYPVVEQVVLQNRKTAADYRNGKNAALQPLIGAAIRATNGRGNPEMLEILLKNALSKPEISNQ